MVNEHASSPTIPDHKDDIRLDQLRSQKPNNTDVEGEVQAVNLEKHVYPSGLKLGLIVAALASSVFLVALVRFSALHS